MKQCIVTTSWDDGSKLDLKLAELLDKHDVKGTFYIPWSYLDNPLKRQDIAELDKRFEIGAHTLNHIPLTSLNPQGMKQEIEESKVYLEEILGHSVAMFCYPKGRFNEDVKNAVRNTGFLAARTANYGDFNFPHDPYEWQITLHASNGSPRLIFKTWLKSGISVRSLIDWEIRARLLFDLALKKGGIYHLWGHSWEIDENAEWDKLERVISYISGKENVSYVTNGDIFRNSHRATQLPGDTK